MGHVDDDAESVHLGDRRAAEITEAAVVRLPCPVAERIAAIVGQVHHLHAQVAEDLDHLQLIAIAHPTLGQRHPVGRECQAVASALLRGDDFVGSDGLEQLVAERVGRERESGQALEQAKRIVPFFARVLEDAGDPRRVKRVEELTTLDVIGGTPSHRHLFAQVDQGGVRRVLLNRLFEGCAIDRGAGREPIGLEDECVRMKLQAAFQVLFAGLEQGEGRSPSVSDRLIGGGERPGIHTKLLRQPERHERSIDRPGTRPQPRGGTVVDSGGTRAFWGSLSKNQRFLNPQCSGLPMGCLHGGLVRVLPTSVQKPSSSRLSRICSPEGATVHSRKREPWNGNVFKLEFLAALKGRPSNGGCQI